MINKARNEATIEENCGALNPVCVDADRGCARCPSAQPKSVPRIGILRDPSSTPDRFEVFQQGLHELGYVEGKTLIIYPGVQPPPQPIICNCQLCGPRGFREQNLSQYPPIRALLSNELPF